MTYHIKLKEYSCPKCQMPHIPLSLEYPCPKCNYISLVDKEQCEGFIDEILNSMIVNKRLNGRYIPEAWLVASTADAVMSSCFQYFDSLELNKPSDSIAYISDYTARMGVDDEYNRKYIKDVFLAVNKRYQGEREPRLIKRSLLLRILRMFI